MIHIRYYILFPYSSIIWPSLNWFSPALM